MNLLKAEKLLFIIAEGSTSYINDIPACSFCNCILEDEEHDTECEMILARKALGYKWENNNK